MVKFLHRKGIDMSRAASRSVEQLPNIEFAQILVALSPEAKRSFSTSRKAVWLDWSGLPDPCRAGLSPDEKETALEDAFQFLHQHISDLCEAVLADKID